MRVSSCNLACSRADTQSLRARCLQYHVSRWKAEATSASHQSSTSSISGDCLEAIPKRKDAKAASPNLTSTATLAAASTSAIEYPATTHSSNNGIFTDLDSSLSQTSVHASNSDILSIFGHKVQLPDFDPTLTGDCEIPWVPHTSSEEIGSHGVDITCDDFFNFIELDPSGYIGECR